MTTILDQARQGTPLIDGETATFVWQGEEAPQLVGDWTDWEDGMPVTLSQDAPGVWTHTMTLPNDAYLEYVFWQDGERVPDPLNARTTPNGMGQINHFFYMPQGAPTPLARRKRNIPHGTVERCALEDSFLIVGGKRTVHLYRPPVRETCPLLVVLDGHDYYRRARLTNIVDNLIAQGRIQPLAMALVGNHRQARGVEYACGELSIGFLNHRVLPLAQEQLDLVDIEANPGAYGILGASMGGLQALYTGVRAPHIFGHVLSQSGAFSLVGQDFVVWDLVRHGPVAPLRVWMDVGRFEWLLDCNRRIHELLVEKGYDVAYREYNAGHNYPAWRDDIGKGLESLFSE
jgi:enterochelin esterase-like enzyme